MAGRVDGETHFPSQDAENIVCREVLDHGCDPFGRCLVVLPQDEVGGLAAAKLACCGERLQSLAALEIGRVTFFRETEQTSNTTPEGGGDSRIGPDDLADNRRDSLARS